MPTIAEQRDNRRSWIWALRNGRFLQQHCGGIRSTRKFPAVSTYCCLGVAGEIFDVFSEDDPYPYSEIERTLGLVSDAIFIELNDADQKSFCEIADLIEKHENDPDWFFQE